MISQPLYCVLLEIKGEKRDRRKSIRFLKEPTPGDIRLALCHLRTAVQQKIDSHRAGHDWTPDSLLHELQDLTCFDDLFRLITAEQKLPINIWVGGVHVATISMASDSEVFIQ